MYVNRQRVHLPWALGIIVWREELDAPALCPNSVTWLGSPPKAAMLSLTNSSAAIWSNSPMLPGTSESPVDMKPEESWRLDMEMISELLALCEGIHRWPVDSPHKGLVMRSFWWLIWCSLNKLFNSPRRSCDRTVAYMTSPWLMWCNTYHVGLRGWSFSSISVIDGE